MDLTDLMARIDDEINGMKLDSRYRLVIINAQRARELMQGSRPLAPTKFTKEITIALDETLKGRLKYLVGPEARVALKEARIREASRPKALVAGTQDTEEIKNDPTQHQDDPKPRQENQVNTPKPNGERS